MTFDRLASIDRLTSGGIGEQQVPAHAAALESALGDTVATKTDLRDLGRELRSEMEGLREDIRQMDVRIGKVETRLDAKIETMAASVKVDILRWLLVTQAALGGFLFAALKFVH